MDKKIVLAQEFAKMKVRIFMEKIQESRLKKC